MRVLLLAVINLSASASVLSVPGSASPFAFASAFDVSVSGSLTLLLSALPSAFDVFVLVPRLSTLLSSAFSSASGVFIPVPGSSAFPSMSSMSSVSVPILRLLAPLSISGIPISGPGLSRLSFPIWSFLQIPMPVPERQKLGQWSGIIKKASSKEAPTTFVSLFLPSERLSPLFFSSSGIAKKRRFHKIFNIDYRSFADDHVKENVDLSFAEYQCSPAVKANRLWQ